MSQPMQQQHQLTASEIIARIKQNDAAEIPIAAGPTADPLYGPIGRSASSGSGSTGVGSAGSASGASSGNAQAGASSGNAQAGQSTITGGIGGIGGQPHYPPSYTIVIHDPQIGDRVFGPCFTSVDAYAIAARYHQKYLYGTHMTTTLIIVEDPSIVP